MEAKEFKFINYMIASICIVGVDKKDNGCTYEVYSCNSRTTALQFLKSIPPSDIPSLYYVIVETPYGNFGKDIDGIYKEYTGELITITKEDIIVPPQFSSDLQRAKTALLNYMSGNNSFRASNLDESLGALNRIILSDTFAASGHGFQMVIFSECAKTYLEYFETRGNIGDLEKAMELSRQVLEQTPPGSLNLPTYMSIMGKILHARYKYSGNLTDLEHAIRLHERAVNLIPIGSYQIFYYLVDLGTALRSLYHQSGNLKDIDRYIYTFQKFEDQLKPVTPEFPLFMNRLGVGLLERYQKTGNTGDLDRAIKAFQEAVNHTSPGSHSRSAFLSSLGLALGCHYEYKGNKSDLKKALELSKQAVNQTPPNSPDIPNLLGNLGRVLKISAGEKGNLADVEFAIQACQKVLEHTPEKSTKKPIYLNLLSQWLMMRYERTSDKTDFECAIKYSQEALNLTPPNSPQITNCISILGDCLYARYNYSGDKEDLEKAIRLEQQALNLIPSGSKNKLECLINLGSRLRKRFNRLGNLSDLDRSIQLYEQALKESRPGSQTSCRLLNNVGLSLIDRYTHNGDLADLERSIQAFEQALEQAPPNLPNYAILFNSLGVGLHERYLRTGDIDDLERSIQVHEQAVNQMQIISTIYPNFFNNLGNFYGDRYYRTKNLDDLDKSIQYLKMGIEQIPPESPDLPHAKRSLGLVLLDCYNNKGNPDDLKEANKLLEEAISLTPKDSPHLAEYLSSLGSCLIELYHRDKNLKDIDRSISLFQKAVDCTRSDSRGLPHYLNNLAVSLGVRYEHTGKSVDMEESFKIFQKIAKDYMHISYDIGLISARNWGNWAFNNQNWEEAAQAYNYAYKAIKQLTKIQLVRRSKEIWLYEYQGRAAHAAYAMAKTGDLEGAVVTLEQGIAQLLTEVLERDRLDLEQLKELGHIDIYKRYYQAAQALNKLEGKEYLRDQLTLTDEALKRVLKKARADMDDAIDAIRQVKGYERFLDAPGFLDIKKTIKANPLIYICVTSAGGLALILPPPPTPAASVIPIWLPKLTEETLKDSLGRYLKAYQRWCANTRNPSTRAEWFDILDETTRWLWQTLMGQLVETLSPYGKATIIPTGLLGLLPLHAAWKETPGTPTCRHYALDTINIAYAPNARTLVAAQDIRSTVTSESILAVNEPKPVNAGPLPNSDLEVQATISNFPIQKTLAYEKATRETVLAELSKYSVLHFSCHGHANFNIPLEGGLLMANNKHLSLRDLLELNLKGVRLAVLSACETGIPGIELSDEVVSLSTGFLQARSAGVVASLWSVADMSTMMLMTRFYRLWREGKLEPAEALRQAQQWVRDTTAEEKIEYFESFAQKSPGERKPGFTDDLHQEFILHHLKEYDFSHPFHWAAFSYMGV